MNRPTPGRVAATHDRRRRSSGRLRAFPVHDREHVARRCVKFKCRNCGQKVLVDAALSRLSITCPTWSEVVEAPRLVRFWMKLSRAGKVQTLDC